MILKHKVMEEQGEQRFDCHLCNRKYFIINYSTKTTSMKLQFLHRFAFKYALATHLEWHQLEEKDLTKSRVEEGEVGEGTLKS